MLTLCRFAVLSLAVSYAFSVAQTAPKPATAKPAAIAAPKKALLPYQDPSLPAEQRADDLVSRMTLEEKVPQLINTAPAIPRLGVPAYDYWNEGLHGVARSGYATMFPQAIGMAAAWDTGLIGKIGETISTEARAKYHEAVRHNIHSIYFGLTIWSPNINIFRDPRWGRGQETYGEDPYLTSRLGVSFVRGLQGNDPRYYKTIATPKHFAVHSGPEESRHRFNVDPSPHDLWDTYLPAFRATILEARGGSIMCAYNAIEKSPACASKLLLQDILRDTWGFNGFVTSDCGAIDDFYRRNAHHTSSDAEHASADGIRGGTDTNCGKTYLTLVSAVNKGVIKESELDISLRRLFTARFKLGLFDPDAMVPYSKIAFSEVASPAHQALALTAARESMVLLKNDGILPFAPTKYKTIAAIGPNAATLSALEGNYNAMAKNPVLPVDALKTEFPTAKIVYAQGSPYAEGVMLPVPRTQFRTPAGAEGLAAEYFADNNVKGTPVLKRTDKQIDFDWDAADPAPTVPSQHFAIRWTGTVSAPAAGEYSMHVRFAHCDHCADADTYSIYVDGKQVGTYGESGSNGEHGRPVAFKVSFSDTKPHPIRVEYTHKSQLFGGGIVLEWAPPVAPLREEAVAAAKSADVILAYVGLCSQIEGEEMPLNVEGFDAGDRTDIKLPAPQQQLLEALAATGKPMVVVLLNGSALSVNWANEHANAILEAWYPGEGGGRAIAETLNGKNNPAGRLPVTFYTSIDQIPGFDEYSMKGRTYRYFKGKPLYGFGYGLSYTKFAYSNIKLSTSTLTAGDTLTVEADVKNTGKLAGDEVAELYLTPPQTSVSPALALQGFQRFHLLPGATKHVVFTLDPRQISQVDAKGTRLVSEGEYKLSLGGSQPADGETVSTTFTVQGTRELAR